MKSFKSMNTFILKLAPLALCVALASCGGSGAGQYNGPASATTPDGTTGADPAAKVGRVTLFADSTVLATSGKKPIIISAVVLSPENLALSGKKVSFSVTDASIPAGVLLQVDKTETDQSGIATAKLSLIGDLTERDVKITAIYADAVPGELVVRIAGNTIIASGPAQLPLNGDPLQYSLLVKDSAGVALPGRTVTIASKSGNTVSPTTAKTDAGGQVLFSAKGVVAGDDTFTATALGVSATKAVKVSGESLAVTVSAPILQIGQDGTVNVTYASTSGAGSTVTLATTAGKIRPAGAPASAGSAAATATLVNGAASFLINSPTASPATVSALVNGSVSTAQLNFVSITPATISVQPSPAIIGPNLGDLKNQRSQLVASVRDAQNNPVAGKTVSFTAVENPSGGTIEPSVATTDFSGSAVVSYISGPITTPSNGIKVIATVTDSTSSISSSPTYLSVSQQGLFVRLGTDNKLEAVGASFKKVYNVVVTDSTGNAVPNALVQAKLTPAAYRLGEWKVVGLRWEPFPTATFISEDTNNDGQCTAAKDANSDGVLTPGNIASVGNNIKTDQNGVAAIEVVYPQSFAYWVDVQLEATAAVGGSEGRSSVVFPLPQSSAAILNVNEDPPGRYSPFPYNNPRPGIKCGQ
jgi:Bacterial Ig-like domain (group 1)